MNFKDMWQEYEAHKMEQELKRPGIDKFEGRVSKHVKRYFHLWLVAALVGLVIFGVAVYYFPVLSKKDPLILWRAVAEKNSGMVNGIGWVTGFVFFWLWVTNGNLLGATIQDARASSNFLCALVLSATLIFIFS